MKRKWKRIWSFVMLAVLCTGILYSAAGWEAQAATKKTIAKALTRKTYKSGLKYTDKSLYLPDFGAFSKLECELEDRKTSNNGKTVFEKYTVPEGGLDTYLADYIELLQENRFQLTLADTYYKAYSSDIFASYSFDYTGGGKVTRQEDAQYSDGKVDYHVNIWYSYDKRGDCAVWINYSPEFKVVDTLDRVGGEKIENPVIKGTSARKGVVQTTSGEFQTTDGRLSAKAGYADIIVNGKHYKKKVMFTSDGVQGDGFVSTSPTMDYFKIDNYRKSDDLFISFPYNSGKKGALYSMEDLMYREPSLWKTYMFHNKTHKLRFGIQLDDEDYLTAWGNDGNIFDYMTIRVLNWNKKGTTLVYFAAKMQEPGKKAYTIEGLIAGKYKKGAAANTSGSGSSGDSSSSSSDSSGSKFRKDCTFCGGSGDCSTCSGWGKVYSYISGERDKNCTSCNTSGRCRYCGGSGKQS